MSRAIDARSPYDPRSGAHAQVQTLNHLHAVADPHPADTFGPQHAAVLEFIDRLKLVTPEQDDAIEAAWFASRGTHRFGARSQASRVASDHLRLDAQIAARQRAWSTCQKKCRDAAGDVVHALAVRDLIGEEFEQWAYDELVRPWVTVMGALDSTP